MKTKNKPCCINGLTKDTMTVQATIYMVFSYYDINFHVATLADPNALIQFSVKKLSTSSRFL